MNEGFEALSEAFKKLACQNIDIRITDFFSESKYSELKKKKLKLETEAED
jgi:hypothetical protein